MARRVGRPPAGKQVARQLRVIGLLAQRQHSITELAKRLNSDRTTIQNDVDILTGVLPIEFDFESLGGERKSKQKMIYWIKRETLAAFLDGKIGDSNVR